MILKRKIRLNFIIKRVPKFKETPLDILENIIKLLKCEGKQWLRAEIFSLKKDKKQLFYILLLENLYAKMAILPKLTEKGKQEIVELFNELKIISFILTIEDSEKNESIFWDQLTETTYQKLLIEITKIVTRLDKCKLVSTSTATDSYLRDLDYAILCIEDSLTVGKYHEVSEIATFYKNELGRRYLAK